MTDAHRPTLLAVAYRMLGSRADAEDAVQEAYLRYDRVERATVRDPRAYLTTLVTRICIDQLRSARVRREQPGGVSLPEPLDTGHDKAHAAELASSLSVAFLLLLQQLSPVERAVFLLREAFDYSYEEVAAAVGKSPVHCRQLLARAKKKIRADRRGVSLPPPQPASEALVHRFIATCAGADIDGLLALLTPDAVLVADGGSERPPYGRARALRKPVEGADAVARFAIAVEQQVPEDSSHRVHSINGAPAILRYVRGRLVAVVSFAFDGDRIRGVYVNAAPEKLRGLGDLQQLS